LRRLRSIGVIATALVFMAVAAWASEQGGGEAAHGGSWMNLFWRTVNFVIFVAIIYKLAGKRIREFFTGRRHRIATELKDLETRKADTEKRLAEVEQSIADLDKKREDILAEYKQQGEALKESIVAKAHERAEQIQAQAEKTAQQELRQAVKDVRAEIAEAVASAAEKSIADKLNKEDHKKLVQDYLTKVVLN